MKLAQYVFLLGLGLNSIESVSNPVGSESVSLSSQTMLGGKAGSQLLLAAVVGNESVKTVESLIPVGVYLTVPEAIFLKESKSAKDLWEAALKSYNPQSKEILRMLLKNELLTGWRGFLRLTPAQQMSLLGDSNPANLTGDILHGLVEHRFISCPIAMQYAAKTANIEQLNALLTSQVGGFGKEWIADSAREQVDVDVCYINGREEGLNRAIATVATTPHLSDQDRLKCLQFLCSPAVAHPWMGGFKQSQLMPWRVREALCALAEQENGITSRDVALVATLIKDTRFSVDTTLEFQVAYVLRSARLAGKVEAAEQLLRDGIGLTVERVEKAHDDNAWWYQEQERESREQEHESRLSRLKDNLTIAFN